MSADEIHQLRKVLSWHDNDDAGKDADAKMFWLAKAIYRKPM